MAADGVRRDLGAETRWERVDIKSVSLLCPTVLAKQAAREHGAREAWFVDKQGFVTEGSSSNAWIVTKNGTVVTPPCRPRDPQGRHPHRVLDHHPRRRGLKLDVAPFTIDEAAAGARSLHHLGEPDRDAGGQDRRPAGR